MPKIPRVENPPVATVSASLLEGLTLGDVSSPNPPPNTTPLPLTLPPPKPQIKPLPPNQPLPKPQSLVLPLPPPKTQGATEIPDSEAGLIKLIGNRYDQLNSLWTKAENSLKQFLVPHEVSYFYSTYYDHDEDEHYGMSTYRSLSWKKAENGWCITVEKTKDCHPNDPREVGEYILFSKPISECSIELRLEMVQHFPKLREKVVEAAKANVATLDKAIAEFAALLK